MSRQTSTTSLLLLLAAALVLAAPARPCLAVAGGSTDMSLLQSTYSGLTNSYVYSTRGGTSVAIGYFTMVTAAHYTINTVDDTTAGYDTFVINGDTWRVASAETVMNGSTNTDIRILHMENMTNQYRALPGFYNLYTYSGSWPTSTKSVVIIGAGDDEIGRAHV